ncbi:MAG: ABC transporter permease [Actinobacteria bacterium]|nr:ABC transporter permease [Actinomycetota bacterium]
MEVFITFTVFGLATGAVYAVAASGLVVTYVTSGIFNIAHGAIGMFSAFLFWQLHAAWNWPTLWAFLAVILVLAPLMGAVIERVLIRNLRGATIAQSLVVTVGLMVLLLGLAQSVWPPGASRTVVGLFTPKGIHLGEVFVSGHQLFTMAAGIGVAIFIYVFLNRTRVGVAMRAVVDDRNLASLTGARPDRVSQLSWAIGSSLAGLSGILLAPILSLNVITLTLLIVNAFAAAMMGRLKSLPLTFAGALALGLIENYAIGYLRLSGWLAGLQPALPTIFLFLMLLLLPESRLRAGRLVGAVTPPVPSGRRALTGAVALVAAMWGITLFLGVGDVSSVAQGLGLAIIMLSLVLLTGYGGQVSLGQMTFAGVGAYVMAKVGGGESIVGYLVAAIVAGGLGAVVALPSLRLQGLYLALWTMAFALLVEKVFFDKVLGLSSIPIRRLEVFGMSFASDRAYVVLLAAMFGLVGMMVLAIRRGPFGRLLMAMRDSPVACATLGLSLTRTKLSVFMLSAAMAGLGGALYAGALGQVGSVEYLMLQSLPLLLLAVIGGITTVSGALIGGFTFALLPILQAHFPQIAGLQPLLIGAAAISVGRNANGAAFQISEGLRKVLPERWLSGPHRTTAAPADTGRTEEVTPVAAAAG